MLATIKPDWSDFCIVAATGPSLTREVAEQCRGHRVIAVNDAYRLLPFADVLYACDEKWWNLHKGCPSFAGEKWSSHSVADNPKLECAKRWGLNLVAGRAEEFFSTDPALIHYGSSSGYQGINFAIHRLAGARRRIVLVGFDMRTPMLLGQKRHFFGDHPNPLSNVSRFEDFIPNMQRAAANLPEGLQIINATPDSALTCFPKMDLADALPVAIAG